MQKKINKEDWIGMFRDTGMSDEAMMKWHHLFETRHPESHEDFLTWLGIPTDDPVAIPLYPSPPSGWIWDLMSF